MVKAIIPMLLFLQMFMSYYFFHDYMEWNVIISTLLSFVIGIIPIVGGIFGYIGATEILHWHKAIPIVLFFVPCAIPFMVLIVAMINNKAK